MFTGIIDTTGKVTELKKRSGNLQITIHSSISLHLKINQSVSHNGVCLTVVKKNKLSHTVEAVEETLKKSNLGLLKTGELINLERAMQVNGRFDGHIVQGHIDCIGKCLEIKKNEGSSIFKFSISNEEYNFKNFIVEKGSITINGVSLTAFNVLSHSKTKSKIDTVLFSVSIIPYTLKHTNFQSLKKGDMANIEFDVIGKYVEKIVSGK